MRVLVVASSEILRAGLESLLAAIPSLSLVGSSLDVNSWAQQVEDLQPEVVLLELGLQSDESLAILTPHMGLHNCAIVLLVDDPPDLWVAEALRSGARAILPRDATVSEMVAALEAVAVGLTVLHPGIIDSLRTLLSPVERVLPASQNQMLTPREIEVLGMLANGLGNKEIAWRLGISEHTVKFHVGSILTKLNASSRTEAVTVGIRQGLIMV